MTGDPLADDPSPGGAGEVGVAEGGACPPRVRYGEPLVILPDEAGGKATQADVLGGGEWSHATTGEGEEQSYPSTHGVTVL